MIRRLASTGLLALATCFTVSAAIRAQDNYPSRSVRIIVPTPPGGPVDVVARLVAQYLSSMRATRSFRSAHGFTVPPTLRARANEVIE